MYIHVYCSCVPVRAERGRGWPGHRHIQTAQLWPGRQTVPQERSWAYSKKKYLALLNFIRQFYFSGGIKLQRLKFRSDPAIVHVFLWTENLPWPVLKVSQQYRQVCLPRELCKVRPAKWVWWPSLSGQSLLSCQRYFAKVFTIYGDGLPFVWTTY